MAETGQTSVKVAMSFGVWEFILMGMLLVAYGGLVWIMCSKSGNVDKELCKPPFFLGLMVLAVLLYAVLYKMYDSKMRIAEKAVDALVELEKTKSQNAALKNGTNGVLNVQIHGGVSCKTGAVEVKTDVLL